MYPLTELAALASHFDQLTPGEPEASLLHGSAAA
jgi:hypothetical protein